MATPGNPERLSERATDGLNRGLAEQPKPSEQYTRMQDEEISYRHFANPR